MHLDDSGRILYIVLTKASMHVKERADTIPPSRASTRLTLLYRRMTSLLARVQRWLSNPSPETAADAELTVSRSSSMLFLVTRLDGFSNGTMCSS